MRNTGNKTIASFRFRGDEEEAGDYQKDETSAGVNGFWGS